MEKKTYTTMDLTDLGSFKTLTTGSGVGNADGKSKTGVEAGKGKN